MKLMRLRERVPDPDDGSLGETFKHPQFTEADDEERARIMWRSSKSRYEDELSFPWDNYFGMSVRPWVKGTALDLGCFTGGRAVAWRERYEIQGIHGVDVDPIYIEAAHQFAAARGVSAEFRVGFAENIPWADRSFDTILSFDVLEHVRDVAAALMECRRVLRPGGRLLAVFPSYFQPGEHHLSLVTATPGLQCLFTGQTLIEAYCEVLRQRGEAAAWYGRPAHLAPWERGNTIKRHDQSPLPAPPARPGLGRRAPDDAADRCRRQARAGWPGQVACAGRTASDTRAGTTGDHASPADVHPQPALDERPAGKFAPTQYGSARNRMSRTPKPSVVVVTHNSADVIEQCLVSVRQHLPDSQIIVVDNASSDKTVTRSQEVANVMLLPNSENLGFGRACNRGAQAADGPHVVFLNPDVRVIEIDPPSLLAELSQEPFGLRGPLFRDGSRTAPLFLPDRSWPIESLAHALGPLRPRELPALPRVSVRRSTWWPAGAMLLCSRAEFLGLGGFRPEFFLYHEDRDLARRYRVAGLPVGTTRSIIAVHTQGTSSASEDSLRTFAGGWEYLGWIEYMTVWHGHATARRAVACADWLRAQADGALTLLASRGPLSGRAQRKRVQLRRLEEFVRWQSTQEDGTADRGFCPHARELIAGRGA